MKKKAKILAIGALCAVILLAAVLGGILLSANADITLKVTANAVTREQKGDMIHYIDVYVEFDWGKAPGIRSTDTVTVSWDSNVFTYRTDTFYAYETVGDSNGTIEEYQLNRPTELTQGTLGYEPMSSLPIIIRDVLGGGCHFQLLPATNPMYETTASMPEYRQTSIYVRYRHNRKSITESANVFYNY